MTIQQRNQAQMILENAIIVPSTVVVPENNDKEGIPDSELQQADQVVSILCWLDHPRSIISLRGARRIFENALPNFFNPVRHEARRIQCRGYVSYMMMHRMTIPVTDARFSLSLIDLTIEPEPIPIYGQFQKILNITEGSIIRTTRSTATQQEGFTVLDFATRTTQFRMDEPEDNRSTS